MKKNLKGEKEKITFHFLCISIYFSHSDELDRGFCDIFKILRTAARYSIVGMKKIVNKGSKKDRKGGKKGTEGCAIPSRICSSRYSARCLCAKEPPVSPSWK